MASGPRAPAFYPSSISINYAPLDKSLKTISTSDFPILKDGLIIELSTK